MVVISQYERSALNVPNEAVNLPLKIITVNLDIEEAGQINIKYDQDIYTELNSKRKKVKGTEWRVREREG